MKYETTDDFLARGGKITVLPEYKPKVQNCICKPSKKQNKGVMK